MYAIIQVGGNQYKVVQGQKLEVDKLSKNPGDMIHYPALLLVDEDKVLVGNEAEKVLVTAKVIEHKKGNKINILRFRAKSRYTKRKGFRPENTILEIKEIGKKAKIASSKPSTRKKPDNTKK